MNRYCIHPDRISETFFFPNFLIWPFIPDVIPWSIFTWADQLLIR